MLTSATCHAVTEGIALVCQVAGSGSEAIQGLGSYFLTLPYGGIKMAVAMLGAIAGGMGFIFTGGYNATADKI